MEMLSRVLSRIDAVNAADPNVEDAPGGPKAAALLYGRRMSEVLHDFETAPSEVLQIAARGQHIERWTRPRSAYPEGRAGYLTWRRDAQAFHAQQVAGLMQEAGYAAAACARVTQLMLKSNLKTDPEAQTLEDVACLVFFRWYAGAFSEKQPGDRLLAIVSKTARKMSAKGRSAALTLGLPPHVAAAIEATP